MLILLRVYHSCVGCFLVAHRKENCSRLFIRHVSMVVVPIDEKKKKKKTPTCHSHRGVQSVRCSSCRCCVLSTGNHLLANGPWGRRGTLKQGAQMEGPRHLIETAQSCQGERGSHTIPRWEIWHRFIHSTAVLGGALAQPQPKKWFGKHSWCPPRSLKYQVAWHGSLHEDSSAWMAPWCWHRSPSFGSQHVSSCCCPQRNHFLLLWKDTD